MRKYFIRNDLGFSNTYALCYTDDGETPDGWEQITRAEAERLARAETRRRKDDPSFSGYADEFIVPFSLLRLRADDGHDIAEAIEDARYYRHRWFLSGRVVEKKNVQRGDVTTWNESKI